MVRRQGDDKFLTNRLSLPFFMLIAFSVAGHALTAGRECDDVEKERLNDFCFQKLFNRGQ